MLAECEKLKIEYKNSLIEQKPKPKSNNPTNGPKTKAVKLEDKSQSNENDSGLGQYESDQSSLHENDMMSPIDSKEIIWIVIYALETKKKQKTAEKKESKRKLSYTKGQNALAIEKSPIMTQVRTTIKNMWELMC